MLHAHPARSPGGLARAAAPPGPRRPCDGETDTTTTNDSNDALAGVVSSVVKSASRATACRYRRLRRRMALCPRAVASAASHAIAATSCVAVRMLP